MDEKIEITWKVTDIFAVLIRKLEYVLHISSSGGQNLQACDSNWKRL